MTQSTPTSPMQLSATWDAVAEGYAAELAPFARFVDEALRVGRVGAGDRVLDVGTGPGTLALAAAPRVAHVTAVDFSPGMIAQLQARAASAGIANVTAEVMDAQALAVPDGAFDAAFSLFAFMFIPDRARAFAELRRALRPGGRAVVLTWGPIERRPLMKIGFDALAEALPDMPAPQKGDLQQTDECVRELSAAGFRDVQSHAHTEALPVKSPEQYVQLMVRTGAPFAALKKRLGQAAWDAMIERMTAAVRKRIPDHGADLAAEAIVTTGTR